MSLREDDEPYEVNSQTDTEIWSAGGRIEETCTYANFSLFPGFLLAARSAGHFVPESERHICWSFGPVFNCGDHLHAVYPGRWIGRGEPVAWPAHSPDLNPLDFFSWGNLKSLCMRRRWLYWRNSRHGLSSFELTSLAHRICWNASHNPTIVGSAMP
ncbi:hypothetical protein TNCV_2060421 [Trichonephila clavipes]|nr:hypothetical protein TNCV_2060421 [Trichonephila clavipes]